MVTTASTSFTKASGHVFFSCFCSARGIAVSSSSNAERYDALFPSKSRRKWCSRTTPASEPRNLTRREGARERTVPSGLRSPGGTARPPAVRDCRVGRRDALEERSRWRSTSAAARTSQQRPDPVRSREPCARPLAQDRTSDPPTCV